MIVSLSSSRPQGLWADLSGGQSFDQAGKALADLNQHGALTRGLRAVLTHHLLFAFNRLGVSAEHQYLLATSASQVVFTKTPGQSTDQLTVRAFAGPLQSAQ